MEALKKIWLPGYTLFGMHYIGVTTMIYLRL